MAPAKHAIRGWRAQIKEAAQRLMAGARPLTGPIAIDVLFVFRRPLRLCQPHTKPVLAADERYEDERVLHDVDPDWDNLGKAVSDSLKMVTWVDDCQVTDARVRKRYADAGEQPGVWVEVMRDEQ